MLTIDFLGSGSGGNATLIRWGQSCVLLDCGFGPRLLRQRLERAGVRPEAITGLLLTHEHRDHVAGLSLLARQPGLPVLLTRRTARALREMNLLGRDAPCEPVVVKAGQPLRLGPFELLPFATAHDATEPLGYVLGLPDGRRVGFATDLGHPNPETVEALAGCDLLGIEANHDPELLRKGPYPAFLKRRIGSKLGHLSNHGAGTLLARVARSNLRHVFLMHLSQTNNRPPLARRTTEQRLSQLGLRLPVTVVPQERGCRWPAAGQLSLF